jgi:hypothetical protein
VKIKSICLMLIVVFVVSMLSACNATEFGSVSIDCKGFSVSGWAFDTPGDLAVYATDSASNVIMSQVFPDAIPVDSGVGGSADWTTQPVRGPITLMLNGLTFVGDCGTGKRPTFSDGRINNYDAGATIVGYCSDTNLVIWVLNTGKWYKAGTLTKKQIQNGLAQAASSGKHVKIFQNSGQQVWALTSGELQFHNAMGTKYDFIFAADICG